MLKALRKRSIALLWSGQALSAIGDEIYRVALIWLAVNLIGPDTGYLAAGQCFSLLLLSVFGGKWADHWSHSRTMIGVDSLRCAIVLIPVIVNHFTPITLPLLWFVALSLSGLGAFFDPALQATLPRYSPDLETLRAATGLMSTTIRLARVVGPGIIGLLTPFVPTVHFFTLDAMSFAISAFSIRKLEIGEKPVKTPLRAVKTLSFKETLIDGFQALQHDPAMRYAILAKGITSGAWNLAFTLGLALLVVELAPHDVQAFGLVIAAYGLGNVVTALALGNLRRTRPSWIMYIGHCWLGLGFLLVAVSPNLVCVMLAAAFAAVGGPMNDIPFIDLMQTHFPIDDLPKVFRLKMALETAATLACMLVSPALFRLFSVHAVIAACGLIMLGMGGYGFLRFSATEPGVSLAELR